MRRVPVVIVGAGPAGLAAAIAAARAGAETVVIDEQVEPGGQLRYRIAEVAPEGGVAPVRPARIRERLVSEAAASGVEMQSRTVAWGLFDDLVLGLASERASSLLAAEVIIVATGSTDRPWPFAGGSLPGVFTARAIQMLLHCHRVRPGRRYAIIGGDEAAEVAADLHLAGGEVVVTVDPERHEATLSASGVEGVRAITINNERYAIDVIVVAVGRQADAALAWMGGAAFDPGATPGDFVPALDDQLRTTDRRLLIAGDAAGPADVATALAEGRYAGEVAAAALGLIDESVHADARRRYEAAAPARVTARRQHDGALVQTLQWANETRR